MSLIRRVCDLVTVIFDMHNVCILGGLCQLQVASTGKAISVLYTNCTLAALSAGKASSSVHGIMLFSGGQGTGYTDHSLLKLLDR